MNFQFTGINPVRDASGSVTGFNISFTGSQTSDGSYLNGTVHITTAEFTATAGNVDQINALIAPAVQAMATPTA